MIYIHTHPGKSSGVCCNEIGVFRNICLKFRNRTLGNIGGVEIAAQVRKLSRLVTSNMGEMQLIPVNLVDTLKPSGIWVRCVLFIAN